jgi:hypothetical protein
LFWSFAYNLVGIGLAASGRLNPIWAAAAMALGGLCVVGNSLRLAHFPLPAKQVSEDDARRPPSHDVAEAETHREATP